MELPFQVATFAILWVSGAVNVPFLISYISLPGYLLSIKGVTKGKREEGRARCHSLSCHLRNIFMHNLRVQGKLPLWDLL